MLESCFMGATLLSLGSINADFQVRVDDPPGTVETLLAHDLCRLGGGKAANRAFLGRLYGLDCHLLGRVGADDLAEQALAPLRQVGVNLEGVSRSTSAGTAVSMIMVPPQGKKHIVLASNANDDWDEAAIADVLERIAQASRPSWLTVDCEIPAAVASRALAQARRAGMPVLLDPSFAQRVDLGWLDGLAAITPNCEETSGLLGTHVETLEQAARAVRELSRRGVHIACVKLADGGAVLAHEDGVYHVPGAGMTVVDSTGAGDAFSGVLAVCLVQGFTPLEAACRAVAASDLSVGGYGSQPAYPSPAQIEGHAPAICQQVRKLHG